MSDSIEKPRVASMSPTDVHLASSCRGEHIDISVSTEALEQAFQVTSSTEADRRELVEMNIDAIWHIASERFASGHFERGAFAAGTRRVAIKLEAAELVQAQMHMTGDAARKAAD